VSSTRLVSFVHRGAAAILYEVKPVDSPLRVAIQSELIANEPGPPASSDPRAAALLESPLSSEDFADRDERVVLVHSTKRSKLLMAAAMDHIVNGPEGTVSDAESEPDVGRVTIATDLAVGEQLTMTKFLSYGWSSVRSLPAIRDQVIAAVTKARYAGWDNLLEGQRAYLDDFWSCADVELEGDTELQQAVRFALFHTLQAGARAEQRAIPAKGLTGPGYDGHTFWDTERFVLPVLTYTAPEATRDALRWRHSTLDLARERAHQLGLKGAAFPWRTIRGHECSAYWPAGTAAFHVSANVADAVVRYQAAVEDEVFELEAGLEILVETARLWHSLGHHDAVGRFRIDGVTGPDEYSALGDNNVFTNLLAQQNLLAAAEAVTRHPDEAAELGADSEEAAGWRDAARDMVVPWDEALGVHPQSEGFTDHQVWDFAGTKPDQYPLLLHFPYFDLYRKQVVKQADLVLALHWRGDAFTAEQKARDFGYYEPLTVRDSSLSACTQAIVAAEVGHLELAYDYFCEAAFMDLHDLEHNTRDGVHIASLAGSWLAAVAGFSGMRDHDGFLSFTPRLPARLERLAFGLRFRGRLLKVEATKTEATYTLTEGKTLQISHNGNRIKVSRQTPVTQPIVPIAPDEPTPTQPPGREPMVRQPAARRRRRRSQRR
jgi:alpha,alpha-trehalose phosphorylase